ncbi:MAG: DUF1838 family protein [Chromatiales bacterium]|nr:DUF1838 family protein [Chromatiales bacterium]
MTERRNTDASLIDRRSLLAGLAVLPAAGSALAAVPAVPDDAGRLRAWLKLRADLSGAPAWFSAQGEVWSWVPGEESVRLFSTRTFAASRIEATADGWRLDQHELTWFLDPESGALLDDWENPLTGEAVTVVHRFRRLPSQLLSGDAAAPQASLQGRQLVFSGAEFSSGPAALDRARFPRHSAAVRAQSGCLDNLSGQLEELLDAAVTSAPCTWSRTELVQWLPFMEMGNRPGALLVQASLHKVDGPGSLPAALLADARRRHPALLEVPQPSVEGFDAETAALLQAPRQA